MPTKKAEFNGDPSLLLDVEILKPLAEFPFATRPLSDHLHFIGHGWYLLVGPRDCLEDGLPEETIRACMLVWAFDFAGAQLVTGCDDKLAQMAPEAPASLPPVEKLVSAPGWGYGQLVKAGGGKVMETANYGSAGVFQYKKLLFPEAHIYFRSRGRKNAELPFAISIAG